MQAFDILFTYDEQICSKLLFRRFPEQDILNFLPRTRFHSGFLEGFLSGMVGYLQSFLF